MLHTDPDRAKYLEQLKQAHDHPEAEHYFDHPIADSKEIGGMLSQLASVTQQAAEQDVMQAIQRDRLQFMIRYRRPEEKELNGETCLRLLSAFWRDDLAGNLVLCIVFPHGKPCLQAKIVGWDLD